VVTYRVAFIALIFFITAPFLNASCGDPIRRGRFALDDTIVTNGYPYYRFVQAYDGVTISCWFGEARIRRTDNTSNAMSLFDWNSKTHAPLCMTTLDLLTLVSKTRSRFGRPGDTITYFKAIIVNVADELMTDSWPPTEQIRFITELVDSASGNVIAYMDTLGARSFNNEISAITAALGNLESTHYFILPSFEAAGATYEKVLIRVRPVSEGDSDHEKICRWDAFSRDKMSESSDEYAALLLHIMDSLINTGYLEKQDSNSRPIFRCVAEFQSRAESSEITLKISSPAKDTIRIVVYNESGNPVYSQNCILIKAGETDVKINLWNVPAGVYYLVGTNRGDIILMKRFSYLR
jgi:hypothetical protein